MKKAQRRRFIAAIVAMLAVAAVVSVAPVALGEALRAGTGTSNGPTSGVVVVETRLGYEAGSAAGTGIVVSSTGEVLTNNHVIRGATAIRVVVASGRRYAARVVGYSVSKDIAVLQLRAASGLQTAALGDSTDVSVGDRVTAVGNAGGSGTLVTASGSVTALGRAITVSDDAGGASRLTGLIATNARLVPGDSGGPLLRQGRVVGIDAAASRDFRFQGSGSRGFAIPIDTAVDIASQIETGQRSVTVHIGPTAFLGVGLQPSGSLGQDVRGAIVQSVVPGSPADTVGINPQDVITSFGGQRVSSSAKLRSLVLQVSPGRVQRLVWIDPYGGTNRATVRPVAGPPQ